MLAEGFYTSPTCSCYYPRPVLASGYCNCLCLCVTVCVYQSPACPHDNSSPAQARITKFGPEKQNTLVKIPIVLGGNWPWRSNLTSNSKLTPFWACPNHYSPPILVRISKFRQQMHFISCDQAALWMVFSVRLSVRLSVCHTFLTMLPSLYHHEIFRSYHHGPG